MFYKSSAVVGETVLLTISVITLSTESRKRHYAVQCPIDNNTKVFRKITLGSIHYTTGLSTKASEASDSTTLKKMVDKMLAGSRGFAPPT